ncbi:GspL/Epsl periplasmic domain-containing protein [Bordetella petrii]|uniref:GspL/Epsl periplasmic domain-containing protein n=1 Tax=Bordetella petrii TaxID=94624 RepID=UPI001A9763AD|nr:GspL/Epsl periplasmic domain-containing protein [Bordetella petrii]MBO1113436.1 general secretion pathway protein GspL [Bordetella petrii]
MDKRNTVKNILRVALPPLAAWSDTTPLAYAWLDRQGRAARGGRLAAAALAAAFPQARVQAILHPDDVIVAAVSVPAVPASRHAAAVRGTLEGLVLGDLEALAVGHGGRAADGTVLAAWMARDALRAAWQRLSAAGLAVQAFYPLQVWSDAPEQARPAALDGIHDARWQAPGPGWSLALPQLAPRQPSRWRGAWAWLAAAAAVWILGLNLYAVQLGDEAGRLRQRMEQDVRDAFPDIPVVLDPLRQAQQARDALRAGQGKAAGNDFLSLARVAAQVLPFAADAVDRLAYRDEVLTLRLHDGHADAAPGSAPAAGAATPSAAAGAAADRLADTAAILQRAAALGARVERDDSGAWRILRAQP